MADGGERSIGEKRQLLLQYSTADYVSFVDDDDLVPSNHVARILGILGEPDPPDVVGFRLRYWLDGTFAAEAVHSYHAPQILTPNLPKGVKRIERLPNHLNPVRRELALRVGYRPLNFGEDGDYARRLAKLNPSERFVDDVMYQYLYRSPELRKGERTNEMRAGR